MSLWLALTILCSAALIGMSLPLTRRDLEDEAIHSDNAIYKDQLKEVDRDLFNGAINAPEAEAARLEIKRRLTASEKNLSEAQPISSKWRNAIVFTTAAFVVLGSVGLYVTLGSPNLPSAVKQSTLATPPTSDPTLDQIAELVGKIKTHLQANPNDDAGWRMLGWSYSALQNYPQSAEAYSKAMALAPANTDYKSAYAEALVQTAQGVVTPKAQTLFAEVLAKAPKDSRARFYDALAHEQSDDQIGALDRWLALFEDTPPDAGWHDNIKQRIISLANATGRDVSAVIQSQQDQQNILIRGMVERLAGKLVDNPNDLEGWLRLMQSYQVLNEPQKAKEALATALITFASDAAGTIKIKSKAKELGIN